jgi:hypothetical protein
MKASGKRLAISCAALPSRRAIFQALGRVKDPDLVCSSLGANNPIPLGPPTVVSSAGTIERLNVRISISEDHPVDVFEFRGFAFIITPEAAFESMRFVDRGGECISKSLT